MTERRLIDELATRVMGWKVAPDRYIKPDRGWIASWKFAPLTSLEDAFDLLDTTAASYVISRSDEEGFSAHVILGASAGCARGRDKARAITLALSRALGLEVGDLGTSANAATTEGKQS